MVGEQDLGDLDRVVRIVSVLGTVNATPSFVEHTAVIDGASDLLVQVFGDAGRRAAAKKSSKGAPEVQLLLRAPLPHDLRHVVGTPTRHRS